AGAARIAAAVPAADAQQWAGGNPEAWVRDSFEVAKGALYNFGAEKAGTASLPAHKGQSDACGAVSLYKVGPDYETRALAAMRTQLAKAGLRLAAVLAADVK